MPSVRNEPEAMAAPMSETLWTTPAFALTSAAESPVSCDSVSAAALTLSQETSLSPAEVNAKAGVVHKVSDIGAAIASGSFRTLGMIVAPCSVRTMSEIATGVTTNLLTRAADVMLKQRRPLILMVRETPLHLGHLRTMTALAEMGAIILPPVPAFYAEPKTLADLVDQMVGRTLDLFGYDWPDVKRWGEDIAKSKRKKTH
jgi:4-hydroxy-3-polyprenylbenzoate decarboxylase